MKVYEKIKTVAERSRLTTWLYHTIFIDPKPLEYPVHPASKEEKIVNPYIKHENLIIRHINIKVFDPFGHSLSDTSSQKINLVQKSGNVLHIKSRKWMIINMLLFHENDSLNPLSISETERLLRQTNFVNDARIYTAATTNKDSVDVQIIILDKWAITAPLLITDVTSNVRFRNDNLLGMGHQFEQYVSYRRPDIMNYSGYYKITNIDNTFISGQLSYQTNSDGTTIGLSLNRPFYSPLAKWAGGVNLNRGWNYFSYQSPLDGMQKKVPLYNYGYDIWLGQCIKTKARKKFFDQSTNIILGERYYSTIYDLRPSFSIDADRTNLDAATFIGNIGYSIQQFYKDKFIYRFGANEDIPQGLIIQLLYGITKKEFSTEKYYIGGEIAKAKHLKTGFYSLTTSYGVFFNKTQANDITFSCRLNYFTDLVKIHKWYLRQFVNGQLVYGENKPADEKLTLSSSDLYGFNSGDLSGNSKCVLNLETVAYAPYNIIGFRFAPILMSGFGMIGDQKNKLIQSNLYQAYSLGLMLRNENLISSTFEVSFGYYPFLPNGVNNVFSYNPVTSFTLRVRAFSISKPDFISY